MAGLATILSFLWLVITAGATNLGYVVSEEYAGEQFLKGFDFDAIPDPTHGRVEYVNATVARQERLVEARGGRFIVRPDSKTVLASNGTGRKSVRLISKNQYETSVMIFDIEHMPEGCGTWPAVWSFGPPWPQLGEIDILEGVNDQGPNQVTLHTTDGCNMPEYRPQTGTVTKNSCGIGTDNAGCGVKVDDQRSYGPVFNRNGGGWYAMERTDTYIKVWFWSRTSFDVPFEVLTGSRRVNPSKWGLPTAYFPTSDLCDLNARFGPHNVLINLTFCGDWAGNVYDQSGCPSTCVDYVNNNPSAFKNAFFQFKSLRIYKPSNHN